MMWSTDEDINKIIERMLRNMGFTEGDPRVQSWSYGYSMTIGPDGKPIIREWGTGLPTENSPVMPQAPIQETDEPISQIDIDPEKKRVRVIVEMPGFTKESINISGKEDRIHLSANNGSRRIDTEIPLNTRVDPKSAKATYKNGILDITLRLIETPQKDGVNIEIN